ncbi:hypothetical protein [Enterobacter hormaechei]|uniref:hypothetical protein n=1 Tax=Enterobacter hormaechei TaxID=158836 RepID=UPI0007A8705F|nr:hypothetical protein [Enterobacter hormaechei]SAJ04942.1 Uncharacterised protein [Enterobacter hormaechei]
MKLFEMEGFLRGKCIPRDLKVNETNAEYLVRKFAEADAMCAALAAELSSVLTDRAVILEDLDNTCFEIGMQRGEKAEAYPTPVVANHDAFLAEVRAQGLEMAAKSEQFSTWVQQGLRSFAIGVRQGDEQ